MRIAIIGAGAMGSLFGALLAEAGQEVTLLDIWVEHVKAINDGGLIVERLGQRRVVKVGAVTDPALIHPAELAIVFVKSTRTEAVAKTARSILAPDGLVLTLQNGLGNAELIAGEVPAARVLAGTTAHGATLLGPGLIRHAGVGPTTIGFLSGGKGEAGRRVAEVLTQAGVETALAEDVRPVIWNKLLVNVGINAVTALTGIRNGELMDLDATKELSRAAVEEAQAVARALGVKTMDQAVEHVFKVAQMTAANRSSMGQDVDHQRLTEIRAINGAVVREAERLGLPVPVNQTLTALIETLQHHYQ